MFSDYYEFQNLPDVNIDTIVISTSSEEGSFAVGLGWIGFEATYLVNIHTLQYVLSNSREHIIRTSGGCCFSTRAETNREESQDCGNMATQALHT